MSFSVLLDKQRTTRMTLQETLASVRALGDRLAGPSPEVAADRALSPQSSFPMSVSHAQQDDLNSLANAISEQVSRLNNLLDLPLGDADGRQTATLTGKGW